MLTGQNIEWTDNFPAANDADKKSFDQLCSEVIVAFEARRKQVRFFDLVVGKLLLRAKEAFDAEHVRGQKASFIRECSDKTGINERLIYQFIQIARTVRDFKIEPRVVAQMTKQDLLKLGKNKRQDDDWDNDSGDAPPVPRRKRDQRNERATELYVGVPYRVPDVELTLTVTRVTATVESVRHALERAEEFDGLEVVLPNPIIHADLAGVKRWIPPEPKLDEPEPPQERLTVVQGKAEGGMLN